MPLSGPRSDDYGGHVRPTTRESARQGRGGRAAVGAPGSLLRLARPEVPQGVLPLSPYQTNARAAQQYRDARRRNREHAQRSRRAGGRHGGGGQGEWQGSAWRGSQRVPAQRVHHDDLSFDDDYEFAEPYDDQEPAGFDTYDDDASLPDFMRRPSRLLGGDGHRATSPSRSRPGSAGGLRVGGAATARSDFSHGTAGDGSWAGEHDDSAR